MKKLFTLIVALAVGMLSMQAEDRVYSTAYNVNGHVGKTGGAEPGYEGAVAVDADYKGDRQHIGLNLNGYYKVPGESWTLTLTDFKYEIVDVIGYHRHLSDYVGDDSRGRYTLVDSKGETMSTDIQVMGRLRDDYQAYSLDCTMDGVKTVTYTQTGESSVYFHKLEIFYYMPTIKLPENMTIAVGDTLQVSAFMDHPGGFTTKDFKWELPEEFLNTDKGLVATKPGTYTIKVDLYNGEYLISSDVMTVNVGFWLIVPNNVGDDSGVGYCTFSYPLGIDFNKHSDYGEKFRIFRAKEYTGTQLHFYSDTGGLLNAGEGVLVQGVPGKYFILPEETENVVPRGYGWINGMLSCRDYIEGNRAWFLASSANNGLGFYPSNTMRGKMPQYESGNGAAYLDLNIIRSRSGSNALFRSWNFNLDDTPTAIEGQQMGTLRDKGNKRMLPYMMQGLPDGARSYDMYKVIR